MGCTIFFSHACSINCYMWPALPNPSTYAHYGKEHFSSSMDSSINKLTNYQYTTVKSWRVCFCWGLFLRSVKHLWVFRWPLVGLYRQPPCWKSPPAWLVNDMDHGFSDSLSAMGLFVGHFTLKIAELSCNLPLCGSPPPLTFHPYISACGGGKLSLLCIVEWALNSYRFVANCKPAALGLLKILCFEII